MLKHVKNFNESKEKIVNIEGDSFHSTIMNVTKITTKMREREGTSFLNKVENDKSWPKGKAILHIHRKNKGHTMVTCVCF